VEILNKLGSPMLVDVHVTQIGVLLRYSEAIGSWVINFIAIYS
jgi:hypothetical protein